MKRKFVLDTNVLLLDPQAIFKFEDNPVIIPITVLEEIDRFKKDTGITGENAREVGRIIDELREKGLLTDGVPLASGGILRVLLYKSKMMEVIPSDLREERGDIRIIAAAVALMQAEPELPVVLLTKDTNLRVKADALGLFAQDYEPDEVAVNVDNSAFREQAAVNPMAIIKTIEFDEDVYQAGVSILGYFSTVVKQKYPDTKVRVKIEQEGNTVRLIVETPEGDRELIEKTLEDYGLVVVGEMQPAELLPDKLQEVQLRHKLDLAVLEVTHTKELLALSHESHKKEILHLTEEVASLKEQIRAAFKREDNVKEVLLRIIENYSINGEVKDAILKLSDLLEHEKSLDKEVVLELISIIRSNNFQAFNDIKSYILSSFSGATGNVLSSYFPVLMAALPK